MTEKILFGPKCHGCVFFCSDGIPVHPQERFAYHKRPFWPVLCLKRIGLPCFTFVATIVTCSLQIILLPNYSATYNLALADITLLKTTCHFLLLLVGFNTLTYRKELQLIPYTCGSSCSPGGPPLVVIGSSIS